MSRRALPTAARAAAALLLAAASTGCLATRSDLRLLQDEMRAMRAAQQQEDAARRAQGDAALLAIRTANDSLRALSGRVSKLQTDVGQELYDMGRQLITIQELTGQSQAQIQRLRAQLEDRPASFQPGAPTLPGAPPTGAAMPRDTARGATPSPAAPTNPSLPGPNRMFELAREQFQRGSPGAAREAADELIRTYPTADIVPAAQALVAESYAAEDDRAKADSAYRLVFEKYPKSDRAPNALYKLALSQRTQGRPAAARALLERLTREYPRSDEAQLARDQLRTLR